jgi:hypothetical protein
VRKWPPIGASWWVSRLMLVSLLDGLICVRQHPRRAWWPTLDGWVLRFAAGGGC